MKQRTLVSIGIILVMCGTLVGQSVQELFNQALIQERAAGNLEQAIQLYQRVAKESSNDRALAAQGLLGAARSYQKLGQTAQSRDLYAMVVRTYPEQTEPAAIARENLAATGTVQGTVRTSGGEPLGEAKVVLSGGPLEPEILAQIQAYLKSIGLNVVATPYTFSDPKFMQDLTDALAARGASLANPAWRSNLRQLEQINESRFTARTDSAGHFTIKDVNPGRYTVRSERDGYFASTDASSSATVVTAGRVSTADVSMLRGAIISGKITDASGQPQAGMAVQAYSVVYQEGFPVLQPAVEKFTNDQGEYRLFWLPSGEYVIGAAPGERVSANAAGALVPPGRGFSPAAPKIYYPGTPDVSTAIPVFVRGEAPVSGVDILVRNAPTFHIRGEVRGNLSVTTDPPPDTWSASIEIRGRHPNTLDTAAPTVIPVTLTRAGNQYVGKFDLEQVLPGAYMLNAYVGFTPGTAGARGARGGRGGRGGANNANAPATPAAPPAPAIDTAPTGQRGQRGIGGIAHTDVDVTSGDVNGVSFDIYSNVLANGTVTVNGNAPGQTSVRVALQADGSLAKLGSYQGLAIRAVVADGKTGAFTIPNVLAGRYRVEMGSALPPDLYLADVRQGGVSVFDSGFEAGREAPAPLQVMVRSGARAVEGTVKDAKGKPVEGATAVLIPPKEARQNHARYYTGKSDASGHFKIQGVAPGNYSLFSWQNMPDGAYFNDRFVSRNEDAGRRVSVVQASATAADITLIPSIGK